MRPPRGSTASPKPDGGRNVRRQLSRLSLVLVLTVEACGTAGPSGAPSPATPTAVPTVVTSPSAQPTRITSAIVGKWRLDRTCAAIVRAVTEANHSELIPMVVSELVSEAPAGAGADPCANALSPVKHSHTFWPDGTFNSYDENENEADWGTWMLVDSDTVEVGAPPTTSRFDFVVNGDRLQLTPVIPANCTSQDCVNTLGWAFAVSFPGESWTRESSGAHVP